MELLIGELLIFSAIAVAAVVVARPGPVWVGVAIGVVPFFIGLGLMYESGVGAWVRMLLHLVHALAIFAVLSVAQVVASMRRTSTDVAQAPERVTSVLPDLASQCGLAAALGFELVPEGVVALGDTQLAVHVHPDGTRAELIQTPGRDAGFGLCTELGDHGKVVSVPWDHGLDDDRVRVAGASLPELLEHHRAEVANRVAAGATVQPAHPHEALARTIESDTDEVRETLERPWRSAAVVALQQTPLKGLVGR